MAKAPTDTQAHYDRAVLLHDRDRIVAAQRLYEQAAAAGHPAAMNALGKLLARQHRTNEAVSWLRRAAATGNTEALWNLAMTLRSEPDNVELEQLLLRAERQWLQAAGDETDTRQAPDSVNTTQQPRPTVTTPALPGPPELDLTRCEAAAKLAILYQFRGDTQRHLRWLAQTEASYRAATKTGHPDARRLLSEVLMDQQRHAEAEPWLRDGARAGDDRAMVLLATVLRKRANVREAQRWLRRAARKGNARAMADIGEILTGKRRLQRAKWWLRLAARAGSPRAMNDLGLLLKEGGHYISAAYWYRRAAEEGDVAASHNLWILRQEVGQAF